MKKNQLKSLFLLLLLAAAAPAFAKSTDIMPAGMTSLMESILNVFKGPFVQTLLTIMFCGCAVAYGFNKDNEKMKRNIIAIGVAIGILAAASFITGAIWDAAQG